MSKRYDHLSREELIRLLERRERQERRFGLVWERDDIEHERLLNADFVALDPDTSLAVGEAPYQNLLIEGPNFDALRALLPAFAGRVKCILIDPPYNTGNQDFIYNDSFVEKEDAYRHSKWLEMMFQSLSLARDLLSDDGVMFVHIGEEEVSRLGCLLDQIFPGRKVASFVWRRRSGANDAKEYFVSQDHEYVLCYANPKFTFEGDLKATDAYTNPDNDPRGDWNNDNLVTNKTRTQRREAFYPVQNPDNEVWYACDPDNTWRFASEARLKNNQKIRTKPMEQLIREKRILWPQADNSIKYHSTIAIKLAIEERTAPRNLRLPPPHPESGATDQAIEEWQKEADFWNAQLDFWVGKTIGYGKPRYKRFKSELKRTEKPFSTWFVPASMKKKNVQQLDLEGIETLNVGYTSEGTSLLQEMIGNKDFPYPKPLSLIQGLVRQATGPDDIIVDFFAGSGTTGHAVLKQNFEDEGNRRFILVSTTEASATQPDKNVCRDIAQKRLRAAIEGYSFTTNLGSKSVEGIGGNFLYARTRRIPVEKVVRRIDHAQVWLALQLMHAPTVRPLNSEEQPQILETTSGALVYLPTLNQDSKKWLGTELLKLEGEIILYSWQVELTRQFVPALDNIGYHPIPQTLVERFGAKSRGPK